MKLYVFYDGGWPMNWQVARIGEPLAREWITFCPAFTIIRAPNDETANEIAQQFCEDHGIQYGHLVPL